MPQVMSVRRVTGSTWQTLPVWSSVSALPVPPPQRGGQTEDTEGAGEMEVSKLYFSHRCQSGGVGSPPFTVTYICIRNNIPDKTHTAPVSPQMDVANKY